MQISLRTLLIFMVVGPPLLAAATVAIDRAIAELRPPKQTGPPATDTREWRTIGCFVALPVGVGASISFT